MNPAFQKIITANDAERRDLFLGAAARMGTAVQNVEKDFWACWTLDALFNGLAAGGPRLLFKGGTSLSKAFGLISRFSEDIDITVFRDDLGQPADVAELDALSGKKRRARLEAIRNACQAYIAGPLMDQFTRLAASAIPEARFRVELDPDDKDGQSLLFWYPSVTAATGDYIRSAVKIESGAKSALDPHVAAAVTPYVAQDLPNLDLTVTNVTTVKPERTFWDKVITCTVCDSGMIDAASSGMAGSAFRAITTTCTSLCRRLRRQVADRSRARCRLRSAREAVFREHRSGTGNGASRHFYAFTRRAHARCSRERLRSNGSNGIWRGAAPRRGTGQRPAARKDHQPAVMQSRRCRKF